MLFWYFDCQQPGKWCRCRLSVVLSHSSKETQSCTKLHWVSMFSILLLCFAVVTRSCFSWRHPSVTSSCQKALLTSSAAGVRAQRFKHVWEDFMIWPRARSGKTQMIYICVCVCACVRSCARVSPQVCFAITWLPHNKRGVLQAETDKHLDKLNKAFAHSNTPFETAYLSLDPQACTYKTAGLCVWVFTRDLQNWWRRPIIF